MVNRMFMPLMVILALFMATTEANMPCSGENLGTQTGYDTSGADGYDMGQLIACADTDCITNIKDNTNVIDQATCAEGYWNADELGLGISYGYCHTDQGATWIGCEALPADCTLPDEHSEDYVYANSGVSLTGCNEDDCSNPIVSGVTCADGKTDLIQYEAKENWQCTAEATDITLSGCEDSWSDFTVEDGCECIAMDETLSNGNKFVRPGECYNEWSNVVQCWVDPSGCASATGDRNFPGQDNTVDSDGEWNEPALFYHATCQKACTHDSDCVWGEGGESCFEGKCTTVCKQAACDSADIDSLERESCGVNYSCDESQCCEEVEICTLPDAPGVNYVYADSGASLTGCTSSDCSNPTVTGITCADGKTDMIQYEAQANWDCTVDDTEITLSGCEESWSDFSVNAGCTCIAMDTTYRTSDTKFVRPAECYNQAGSDVVECFVDGNNCPSAIGDFSFDGQSMAIDAEPLFYHSLCQKACEDDSDCGWGEEGGRSCLDGKCTSACGDYPEVCPEWSTNITDFDTIECGLNKVCQASHCCDADCTLPAVAPAGYTIAADATLETCTAQDCSTPTVSGISCAQGFTESDTGISMSCSICSTGLCDTTGQEITLSGCTGGEEDPEDSSSLLFTVLIAALFTVFAY